MPISRSALLSFSALVIILVTGTLASSGLFNHSELNEDIQSPDSNADEIDQQALVEKAQGAVRSQFYENLGQIDNADVRFYGNIPGGTISFGESRVLLWMEGAKSSIVLSFDGAAAVIPQGIDQVSHHTNYFLGDRGTFIGIGGFTGVVYNDLWSGISLFYRATANGAKYEFRVAPGADPADIRVRCEDADSIVIGKASLRIDNGDGTLVDEGLRVFQGATDVEGEFISLGHHVFGFRVDEYDIFKPLVIDPLLYSTYVGGGGSETGYSIAIDTSGNAYVTGETGSTDFPTVNAYDSSLGGGYDVFVFKLNDAGNGLLYSTYVGGSEQDEGYSIAIDTSGNAYVTGITYSSDFPIVNAYDSSLGGNRDAFVFKLNAAGNGLLYSTYVGGSGIDEGYSIAIDTSGNAYVTGETGSTDFPTVNAYYSSRGGTSDAFVFKLNAEGNGLLYSTYVGGSSVDEGLSIAIDTSGNAYVTGYTESLDYPTVNAYDSSLGGSYDVFVFKLNAAGNGLLYSTYVGGSEQDEGYSISIDTSGNAYVTGETGSTDFPIVNAYDSSLGGIRDAFVFKLNASGNGLLYSTYVGGSEQDEGYSIAIDTSGNAYVTGITYSSDFPTVNAYDSSLGGSYDVFVFKLSEVPGAINTGTATYDILFPTITVAIVGGLGLISLMVVFIVLKRRPEDREPEGPLVPREPPEKPTRPLVLAEPIDTSPSEGYEPSETVLIAPPPEVPEEGVHVLRGCTAVGGRFEYKVKVRNETSSVITNATVMILSYPDDCMEISGSTVKTIKRIGPGEFRSPQFTFVPTKDCVEGRIIATVSYIDHHNEPHTLQAEPYMIRSVCDLLEPLVSTMQQFELILGDLEHTSEEHVLPWNPEVLFSKVKAFLPSRNFHIVGASGNTIGGVFIGTIRGLAEGKYTGKKVAVRILISGPAAANEARVVVEGLGEDIAMLPTTIDEIARGIESWTCMNCGAALEPDEVSQIKAGAPVRCRYCEHTMTIDLYRRQ